MDQLKEKRERRGELLKEVTSIFSVAEGEKRDLKADELTRQKAIEAEIASIDDQIVALEANEKRKAELALLQSQKKDITPDVKVGKSNMESEEARNIEFGKVIKGVITRNNNLVNQAVENLKEGGHYRDFNSVVDTDGGIFVPTSIQQQVTEMQAQYGIIPALATNYGTILSGSIKVPSVLSEMDVVGVSEGAEISGITVDLGGIELKAGKWAGITHWTAEIGDQAGSVLVPLLMRQAARSFAKRKDQTFLKGDGTSTYNNTKGLESLAGNVNYVRVATAASGNNSYATLDADDFLQATLQAYPSARMNGVFVFHPNLIPTIKLLKDATGQYIYSMPKDGDKGVGSLYGYPVYFTQAATFDSGSNKVYGYFFDPSLVAYATGKAMTMDLLDQATVKDSAGNTVNLALSNKKAIRFIESFDVKPSNAVASDAGTTKGGFVVLKTI